VYITKFPHIRPHIIYINTFVWDRSGDVKSYGGFLGYVDSSMVSGCCCCCCCWYGRLRAVMPPFFCGSRMLVFEGGYVDYWGGSYVGRVSMPGESCRLLPGSCRVLHRLRRRLAFYKFVDVNSLALFPKAASYSSALSHASDKTQTHPFFNPSK
jgi:hypothetical protein